MGFTANLQKRAKMTAHRQAFLGGGGEAGGESAGKSGRIKQKDLG